MIHWLITVIYPKILNGAMFALGSGLVGILVLTPFRTGLKKIWRAIDSLDPKTDTGVTKQLAEIQREQR